MKSKGSGERKRRAAALHQQIEDLKRGVRMTRPEAESPAAFVHRRMRELAQEEDERRASSKKLTKQK